MAKTPSLGVRVQPHVKDALEEAARDDVRTLSSMVEKIVVEWLSSKGYLGGTDKPAARPPEPEATTRKIAERRSAATQGRQSAERARKRAGVKPTAE